MTKEDIIWGELEGESDGYQTHFPVDQVLKAMDRWVEEQQKYWKDRCLAAEEFIKKSPCDPDTTNEQILAGEKWQSLVDQECNFTEQQNKYNDRGMDNRKA